MIQAESIRKSYRNPVLKEVTFSAEKGDCIGILGTNGCGKSTLLSVLAGASKADGGKLSFFGQDAFADKTLFSKYVAYVPQENPIIEELSVKDNLKLWYSCSEQSLEEAMKVGLPAQFGLDQISRMPAGKLSGGMKKRLSIAGALANQAPILILDEMGASLDLVCKEELRQYLSEYKKQGGMIIMTTHEEEEMDLCNILYALVDGSLISLSADIRGQELTKILK